MTKINFDNPEDYADEENSKTYTEDGIPALGPNEISLNYLDQKNGIHLYTEKKVCGKMLDKISEINKDDPTFFHQKGTLCQYDETTNTIVSFHDVSQIKGFLNYNLEFYKICEKGNEQLKWFEYYTVLLTYAYPEYISTSMKNEITSKFKELKHIATHPIWMPDGNYIDEKGYIEDIHTYLMPNYQTIPTIETVDQATNIIRTHFKHFPWERENDEMRAISFLFTLYLKHLIPGNLMMYDINANIGGAGKGLLIESMYRFITGCDISAINASRDSSTGYSKKHFIVNDDKLLRNLSGQISKGISTVHFDNIKDEVEVSSPALCSLLTAKQHDFHTLYKQVLERYDTEKLLVCSSGNKVKFVDTLERRVITVMLISPTPTPFLRENLPDLKQDSITKREEFLGAMNKITQTWFEQGKPLGETKIGSFEGHTQFISGIMPLLGFKETFTITHTPTDISEIHAECITTIYDTFTTEKWIPKDLWGEIGDTIEEYYHDIYKTKDDFESYFYRYILPSFVNSAYHYRGKDHFDTSENIPTMMVKRSDKREHVNGSKSYIYHIEILTEES